VPSYDDRFFAGQLEGSLRSARVIAPFIVEWLKPASVIDVGCGRGLLRRGVRGALGGLFRAVRAAVREQLVRPS
jgi:hypothetical protein